MRSQHDVQHDWRVASASVVSAPVHGRHVSREPPLPSCSPPVQKQASRHCELFHAVSTGAGCVGPTVAAAVTTGPAADALSVKAPPGVVYDTGDVVRKIAPPLLPPHFAGQVPSMASLNLAHTEQR